VSLLGMSSLLCFLLFNFFALSFSTTFGKDLYADLVAPRLRTSLLGMSSFLCFCFYIYFFYPIFVTNGKVVLLLGTSSLFCFLFFYFLHYLSPQPLARISTPILLPLDFRCRSWVCRLFFVLGMPCFHVLEVLCGSSYNDGGFISLSRRACFLDPSISNHFNILFFF